MNYGRYRTGVTISDRESERKQLIFGRLTRSLRRISLVQASAVILFCLLLAYGLNYFYVQSREYVPLFDTPLSPSQVAGITSSLSRMGVDYSLVNNGRTIKVPRKSKSAALLRLSTEGGNSSRQTTSQSGMQQACISSDRKSQVEQNLKEKTQAILDEVLGSGKAKVAVDASIDSSASEVETYHAGGADNRQGQVKEKEKSKSESYQSDSGSKGDLKEDKKGLVLKKNGIGSTNYKKTESTVVYKVDQTKKREVTSPGGVERITASVVVDDMSPAEIEKLNALIKDAIGADESRGDSVTVVSIPSKK